MAIVLETDRLVLRTWKREDRGPFSRMNADPAVMEFFPRRLDPPESDAFVDRIEGAMDERGYGLWAAEIKESSRFAGFIGFNYTDFPSDFTPCVEIGWRLDKACWGRGYATEGASACLAYGFAELGFAEVYSFTSSLNLRSVRVMQKIGLRKVKDFQHPKIAESDPLCLHVLYRARKGEAER